MVGYFKARTRKPTITWQQSVDEALCVGWIDGVRRGLDDERYTVRFTPRRPGSTWSAANVRRAEELIADGSMRPAGVRAFEARRDDRTAVYSYEQESPKLERAYERRFREHEQAWTWFRSSPASYRKAAIHWVMSAKQEATRERRLASLIADSAAGRRVGPLALRRRS